MHQRLFRPAIARALIGALPVVLAAATIGIGTASSAAAAVAPVVYDVAPTGHGTDCSASDPCALLTAQAKVRAATPTMHSDITVQLADGTYRLAGTLAFDAADGDGGTSGHTVSYQAAPAAHPVISGGERVTGWHPTSGGVWAATVPAGTDTRQLYVDGVRANRAAGPDPTNFTQTATGYTTSDTTMDSWQNITDVEFAYNVGWTQMRCRVAAVSGTTVTMQQPCFDNSTKKPYGVNAGLPSLVENAKELLTNPGQFYLDEPAHTVYYIPREGQQLATADVEIPRLQTVISGTGTEAHPLTGLALRGISVEYGGWTAPDSPDGFSEVQANVRLTGQDAWQNEGTCDRFSTTNPGTCPYGAWTMEPGNVVFDHTDGLAITGDSFEHLGAAGLQLGQDVDGSTLTGNQFTDISGNGLEIGNGTDADPADLKLIPAENTVADNWVHNIAIDYSGGVGIFQGYARDDTIEHNQVNNVPYSGISSNWGWGHTPTETQGNKILNNLVYDAMQQHSDGGGIYVLGQEGDSLADGMLISGNVVRDDVNSGHAIYTDGGSQYITETDNAAFGNDAYSFGGCREAAPTPYGDFDFTGNYYENTTPDWPCGTPDNATVTDNTQVAYDGTGVPASLLANAGLEPAYQSLAAPPAGTAPVNLAAGKPVQAQFLDGSPAQLQPESQLSYATDGNPQTYVQASGQFRWQLIVDLGQAQTLGYLTVGMPQPHFATDFHVDVSTDDSVWTTVSTVHDSGWGTDPIDFATPITARYLRVVADKPDNSGERGDQMAISEIGAYAPTNLAVGVPTQVVDGPQIAVDGNTLVAGQGKLDVDLGAVTTLSTVSLRQPQSQHTPYTVAASSNGTTWTTIITNSATAPATLTTPVSGRYLRFTAVPGQGALWVTKVVAYGSNNTALNSPATALFVDGTQAQLQPGSIPAYGDDGDPTTFTQATNQYRWTYQIDLRQPQSIDVVSLLMPDNAFATRFHIDASLDGSTWWTVARRVDSAGGLTGVQLDEPVTARYLRVIADRPDGGGQTGGQMAISEFSVFGSR